MKLQGIFFAIGSVLGILTKKRYFTKNKMDENVYFFDSMVKQKGINTFTVISVYNPKHT